MFILASNKQCSKCGEWKSFSEFQLDRRSMGAYVSVCNTCKKGSRVEKPKAAPGEKYCTSCKQLKPISKFSKHHHYCKKCLVGRTMQWAKKNPQKAWAIAQNRRALELRAEGEITAEEWHALKKKYNYTCLCCGRREPEIKLTLDHVIPLVKGGVNKISNAQPLCRSCNSSKGTKEADYR